MAKNLGTFEFAANFKVKAAEALDPRMVAASKADLINKANWPADGNTIYVYKGLIVDCGEDGVYRLINPELALDPEYRGWERIDAGGVKIDNVYTYKGSKATYEDLVALVNPEIGDVWNVENEYVYHSELDGTKTYLAGTNWVWNGNDWDALAGAIDLSAYATKSEVSTQVSELNLVISTNVLNIESLSSAISELDSKKVDAVEGSLLITNEKLLQIDSNTNILTNHKGRIEALETNSATKSEVKSLGDLLLVVQNTTAEQGTLISNLTTTVNNNQVLNSTELNNIKSSIGELKVKSVKGGDKVLSVNNGELLTTIKLDYKDQKLLLKGIGDTIISEIDATLLDVYTVGDGLNKVGNQFSVKIDSSSNNKLTVSNSGLLVNISSDMAQLSTLIDNKINEAFDWGVVE